MLPGRASDAGPTSRKGCPACGSSKWSILGYCHGAHAEMCDRCATAVRGDELYCPRCIEAYLDAEPSPLYTGEVDDDLECDCRFTGDVADASECALHGGWPVIPVLHQITVRSVVANIPEWDKEETCPI